MRGRALVGHAGVAALEALAAFAALAACSRRAPALDTSCPARGGTPDLVFAEMAERGIPASPETTWVSVVGETVVIGWKNLLSGRQLTLACAYRQDAGDWRLLHARLYEGTHVLHVTGREDPPALVYRDAEGRLLEVVPVMRSTRDE